MVVIVAINRKSMANQVQKPNLIYSVNGVAQGGVIQVFERNSKELLRQYLSNESLGMAEPVLGAAYSSAGFCFKRLN